MAVVKFHEFETREELAERLVSRVRKNYRDAQKPALLAFSGGSTPKLFLQQLSGTPNAIAVLVDDRWVPNTSERSNEGLLKRLLDIHLEVDGPPEICDEDRPGLDQHRLRILPLCDLDRSIEQAAQHADAAFRKLGHDELTVCVLGMGTDGHTASWFPGGDNLAAATDPNASAIYLPMTAPGADEPRITMTLPPIAAAKNLILHIEGQEKRAVFDKAMEAGNADAMPIRHLLRHPNAKVDVYWAP